MHHPALGHVFACEVTHGFIQHRALICAQDLLQFRRRVREARQLLRVRRGAVRVVAGHCSGVAVLRLCGGGRRHDGAKRAGKPLPCCLLRRLDLEALGKLVQVFIDMLQQEAAERRRR